MTTLAKKLHAKSGMTMCVLDAPTGYQLELENLAGVKQVKSAKGELDILQVFVTRKAQLDSRLPSLIRAMGPRSALWISYPKANALGTDLNRDILRVGLAEKGLTAVAQIAIDDVWSALRFKLTDSATADAANATKSTKQQPHAKTFTTNLVNEGGVEVPFDIEKVFGRKRMPIVVTVNGVKYRTTVMIYGGRYYFPMRREIREKAGVAANGRVKVTIEPDLAIRTIEAPPDFSRVLRKNAQAHARWKKWSYTHRKEMVDWITSAKRLETRQRRLVQAVAMLERA
jgi:hypothetical protein